MWLPMLPGGVYRPLAVIVPVPADPPTTPSTNQVTLPKPDVALNCSVCTKVTTAARGLTAKPTVTVRLVEPLMAPTAAWIVVLPCATAVADPVLLIVATEGRLEVH